jgi:DNA helicase-2/ATP-dependent DNA helicase PcrA
VGITRAKEQLFLTYSQNRSAYGYGEPVLPSRYLDDIPFDLVDELQPYRSHKRSALPIESRPERWETSYEKPVRSSRRKEKNEQEQRFSPGIKVDHPVWGEGLVLNSRLQDDDEIVDVFFADVGLKHLAASLARLEIRS